MKKEYYVLTGASQKGYALMHWFKPMVPFTVFKDDVLVENKEMAKKIRKNHKMLRMLAMRIAGYKFYHIVGTEHYLYVNDSLIQRYFEKVING